MQMGRAKRAKVAEGEGGEGEGGEGGPPAKQTKGNSKSKGDSKRPLVVFAHGAGAPSSSPWMTRWKDLLALSTNAVEVVTFDYPYCAGGKRGAPPKAEKLVDFHIDVIKRSLEKHPGHPLVLAGKSMGSRVSCMVAGGQDVEITAIICLGYPLKGINGKVRDETLTALSCPVMFVQGSKDALCPLDTLQATTKKMLGRTEIHVIEGGDHSFKVGKRNLEQHNITQSQVEQSASESITKFFSALLEFS